MNRAKILLVDDEKDILEMLRYNLEGEGYNVKTAKDGETAIDKAIAFEPDIVVLDIMMPGMDGIEVCQRLRKIKQLDHTLISYLTARSESFTHITALDAGGDDYITKPIKPKVFLSRIKALLRRHKSSSEKEAQYLNFGNLEIDIEKHSVEKDGLELQLAKKEFQLLVLLASKPGKVFKRNEIFKSIWGSDVIVGERTIDVHIRKLREKIGNDYIRTIKGVGYKFEF